MKTEYTHPWIRIHCWAACGFGVGFSPIAPGTVASIAITPVAWYATTRLSAYDYLLIGMLAAVYGVYCCFLASKELKNSDPSVVVWDEFVGMWLSLALIPATWDRVLLALVLFRFFDIVKPPPISTIDKRLKGGLGIVLDDVLAAMAVAIILHTLLYFSLI